MKNPYPWSMGPTAKYTEGKRRFRVHYRVRLPGELEWQKYKIDQVVHSEVAAKQRTIGFISKKHRCEVEVMRVEDLGDEAPVQTGQPVKTVSEKEYMHQQEETRAKTEYERKEALRDMGWWLP